MREFAEKSYIKNLISISPRILFQLALGKNSDELEISWTWLKLISSQILHHNIAKCSAARQHGAVGHALGSRVRQSSAVQCWKSWVMSGKLLKSA